jgi:nickel superoxide dismutase
MKACFKISEVSAHCDVPCGIYETDTVRHSAETVKRMISRINDLGDLDSPEKLNTFVRSVTTKEQHAQKVKQEIYILWSDYFKPEHLEKFPDLHATLWQAAKQASKTKQTISLDEADKLVDAVNEVAKIFEDSKK